MEGAPPKCLDSRPHKCQGHQRQGEPETLSQSRGAEGNLTTFVTWVLDGILRQERGVGETEEI